MATYARPAQVQTRQNRSSEEKLAESHTLNLEALGNLYLPGKGKSVFSNGVSLAVLTTLQGKPHAHRKMTNGLHVIGGVFFLRRERI